MIGPLQRAISPATNLPKYSGVRRSVTGGANVDVAGAADLVIVAVPYAGHADILGELA